MGLDYSYSLSDPTEAPGFGYYGEDDEVTSGVNWCDPEDDNNNQFLNSDTYPTWFEICAAKATVIESQIESERAQTEGIPNQVLVDEENFQKLMLLEEYLEEKNIEIAELKKSMEVVESKKNMFYLTSLTAFVVLVVAMVVGYVFK